MHYLVDAYNLLFRTLKKRGPLEKSRQLLIEELNDAIKRVNLNVTLVFDGSQEHLRQPTRGHFDAIEVVYTSKGQSADEYISDEVMLAKNPSQLTVVTNDRELAGRCKQSRAKILSIDEFIAFLLKKKIKKKKQSANPDKAFRDSDPEIARLMLIFERKLLEDIIKER